MPHRQRIVAITVVFAATVFTIASLFMLSTTSRLTAQDTDNAAATQLIGQGSTQTSANFTAADSRPPVGEHPFSVTIKMFAVPDTTPVATHRILFHQGVVYDFDETHVDSPITIFDLAGSRIVLIDRKSQVRSTVSTNDLIKMTAELKATAATKSLRDQLGMNSEVNFAKGDAANPDGSSDEYSVTFGTAEYRTTTQTPSNANFAREFSQFADWASRLNIARHVGLPPFGRMALNQRLAADEQLPLEMSLAFQRGDQTSHYRSTHQLTESITVDDQKKIDEAGSFLVLYKDVPLKAFPK